MLDENEYEITGDINYQITDYDVRSVVNLYGEDGINEINFMGNFGIVIVTVFLIILMIAINRKFRRKEL